MLRMKLNPIGVAIFWVILIIVGISALTSGNKDLAEWAFGILIFNIIITIFQVICDNV